MSLAAVQTQITVSADATLLDPHQAASVHRIGADTLAAAHDGASRPRACRTS